MASIKNKNHLIQLNFFSIDVNPSPLPLNRAMLTDWNQNQRQMKRGKVAQVIKSGHKSLTHMSSLKSYILSSQLENCDFHI